MSGEVPCCSKSLEPKILEYIDRTSECDEVQEQPEVSKHSFDIDDSGQKIAAVGKAIKRDNVVSRECGQISRVRKRSVGEKKELLAAEITRSDEDAMRSRCIPSNRCKRCLRGNYEYYYPTEAICLAVSFFPCGILCCLRLKKQKCNRCNHIQ